MPRLRFVFLMHLICLLIIAGCGPEIEVGYKPPIAIPVRVSINTNGEIKVGFSGDIVTPIGTFDISAGTSVNTLRAQFDNKILIVLIDDEAVVYELEEGKEFKVNFDDSNTLYKKVALIYESNGDIVLELESVQQANPSSDDLSNTGSQTADPEVFLRDYFYNIVHRRNYQYLWTLATENFQEKNSNGSYQDFVDFWNSVDELDLESIDFYENSEYSVRCNVKMTMYINGSSYYLDLKYHLIFDTSRDTWLFESP